MDVYSQNTKLELFFETNFFNIFLYDFKHIYSYATFDKMGYNARYDIYLPTNDAVEINQIPVQYYHSYAPKEIKVNFFDDFLTIYFRNSIDKFRQENLYQIIKKPLSKDAIYTYLDSKIDDIEMWLLDIKRLYVNKNLKNFKATAINDLKSLKIEFENHLPKSQENFNKDKIKLKMGKSDIYLLFKYLNKKEYLENSEFTNERISELLEKHFLYYNKKLKSYQEITGMKKYAQNIERDSFRKNQENCFNDFTLPT